MIARQMNADVVAPIVRAYAGGPGEYADIYIDHEHGGSVMSLWTGHLAEHEAAVRALLPAGSRVAFRRVEFSERYLRGLQDQITAELAPPSVWLDAIPAQLESVGVDVIANHAFAHVSSANPDATRRIEAHFDVGRTLVVESGGTGAALVPWGEVAGKVRTSAGKLPPSADYLLLWRGPAGLRCGGGDIGYGLAPDGTFTLPCQTGRWTIEVAVPGENDDWRPIGSGVVDVPTNATVELDIVLTETR